ncbi:hypothetical protein [Shinella zoogloeoides]|nr:hypothetical protein [Shinella zoogloeoides]WLR94082.1 hypothetical protein Q9316_07845 [Shinella zoogloeoides]
MISALIGRAVIVAVFALGIYAVVQFLNSIPTKSSTKKGKRNVR